VKEPSICIALFSQEAVLRGSQMSCSASGTLGTMGGHGVTDSSEMFESQWLWVEPWQDPDAIAHHDLFGGFCVSYGDYPAKLLRPRFALIGETVAVIEAFPGVDRVYWEGAGLICVWGTDIDLTALSRRWTSGGTSS
jgi:hypothetical protein